MQTDSTRKADADPEIPATAFRSHEEITAEVLGRWSVSDLTELHDDDLAKADERFHAGADMTVLQEGEHQLIRFWVIQSGDKRYEVRRFQNFAFCSCKGFFFSRKPCRHIARTALVLCGNCGESFAKVGKLCHRCDAERMPPMRSSRPVTFTMKGSL